MEKELIGKRIRLRTNTGKIVTGKLISYTNNMLKIIDKFGMTVFILDNEIALLEEKE